MATHESVLNVRLAQLLKQLGLKAEPEHRQPGSSKRIDIDVMFPGFRVALEAEIGNRSGALKDARKRHNEASAGLVNANIVLAINYPTGLQQDTFDIKTEIEWTTLLSLSGKPLWASGDIWTFASVLRRARPFESDPDKIARNLEECLTLNVDGISANQREALADVMDIDTHKSTPLIVRSAAKRALLIVAAAGMFHARLDLYLKQLPKPTLNAKTGRPYNGLWPPSTLQYCVDQSDPIAALESAWDMILAVDYRPIFETAARVLKVPAQDSLWANCVTRVTKQALSVARSAASTRHDLMGRIFHRLVDTARYDGSYYTSTSAAVLLAGLAITDDTLPQNLSEYKLIDPACGTGTLLMASAERIRDLRDADSGDTDAVTLIEQVISGLDVNLTACHMTATTLGLLSPSTAFSRMNIRLMPLGITDNNEVRVGSLELLEHKTGAPKLDLDVDWASGIQIDSEDKTEIAANSQNLVIMNPPYTRNALRHDQFPIAIENQLKARETVLRKDRAGHGSSSGTMFTDLGEHLVSLEDGATLAFVSPAAMASAPSALEARKLLAEWFHIEWIIAAHDPDRYYFSENTSISEMLVVCRRSSSLPTQRPETKFVVLRQNPKDAVDALAVLAAIERGSLPEHIGETTYWPARSMQQGKWRPLGFTSAYLTNVSQQIAESVMFEVEPLDTQWFIGPDGRGVRGVYTKHQHPDIAGRRALWHNNTKYTQQMTTTADVYIHPKLTERDERLAKNYWDQRSRLLIGYQPRLSTARVSTVCLDQPALGSHWTPVRLRKDSNAVAREKAMCVWLNSTLGWITLVGVANPRVLQRPQLSIDALSSLPVPVLSKRNISTLTDVFEANAHSTLQPLALANSDKTRELIDEAVASELNIDQEELATIRQIFSTEPSIQQIANPRKIS